MIGERLKLARNASGLSMKALGEATGMSEDIIKQYEHNQSMPSSSRLIKLSKALQLRFEYFFRSSKIEISTTENNKASNLLTALDQAERWEELRSVWLNSPLASSLPSQADTSEEAKVFQYWVSRALKEDIINESKAAELLGMPLMKFHKIQKLGLQITSTSHKT